MKTLLIFLVLAVAACMAKPSPYPSCENVNQQNQLNVSTSMVPSVTSMQYAIPFEVFWGFFKKADAWPTWNYLFQQVNTTSLKVCDRLEASFNIVPHVEFPKSVVLTFPTIVKVEERPNSGFYAWTYAFEDSTQAFAFGRHEYSITRGSGNSSWFYSWEKAAGPYVTKTPWEFENTLQAATLAAFEGAACLQRIYLEHGTLSAELATKYNCARPRA
eukprot:Colp12_sorted_trinity150504_noHs@544